jgi:hypothetical protein
MFTPSLVYMLVAVSGGLMSENPNRRQALKIVITIGGVATTVLLPSKWTRPVVQSIVVPAHAQASPARTRSATTTTPPATTITG